MPIKVLHIQSFDWGGAAIAARRLHEGLINKGVESAMLLKWKSKFNVHNTYEYKAPPEIYTFSRKLKNKLKQIKRIIKTEAPLPDYLANAPEGYHQFTLPQSKFNVLQSPLVAEADIVHLHWVADFIDDSIFFKNINKPVVWTMHDMNPFTGGCHSAMDCSNYVQDCGLCPQLAGTINPSYSSDILKIKNRSGIPTPIHVVTPSLWLSECSKTSSVMKHLPHHVIPNGFPSGVFVIRDKNFSRSVFGLPVDKKIALFVSGDIHCKPKGYHLLKEALTKTGLPEDLILCAVGEKHMDIDSGSNVIELGLITDERLLSLVYSAADVFITPSLADNLPNTVVESILCGTPVIAFRIGGLSNMLTHGANGLFCPDISTDSLAKTISEFFDKQHTFINEDISREAHAVYDIERVAAQYVKLYKTILKRDD